MQGSRPLGVTMIAILDIMGGISSFLAGLVLLGMISTIGILLGITLGGILIIIGLTNFVIAYGLWKGSSRARAITSIVSALGIVIGIGSVLVIYIIAFTFPILGAFTLGPLIVGNTGAIIYVVVNALVIHYLYRPNVKAYFGK